MALIQYDDEAVAAFEATRHLDGEAAAGWLAAVARHLDPRPGMRLLDLGAGTGTWARAFTEWFDGVRVVAVEPAEAMRARCVHPDVLAGHAADIPLADRDVDAVWLSNVLHHVPDLPAAAREIHRVLRPGGRVLIRGAFPGRHRAVTLFQYFPEAVRVLDTYPSVLEVETVFTAAGFDAVGVEQVRQVSAPSLRAFAAALRREAHTPLRLITDEEYAAGLARLRAAATAGSGPVVDALDLLVLRRRRDAG